MSSSGMGNGSVSRKQGFSDFVEIMSLGAIADPLHILARSGTLWRTMKKLRAGLTDGARGIQQGGRHIINGSLLLMAKDSFELAYTVS